MTKATITCLKSALIASLLAVLWASCAFAQWTPAPAYTDNQIADAIYKAEGGLRAKKPFGILSVKCEGYDDCRKICLNTIRHKRLQWAKTGRKGTFLAFLASKYAPIGADNDLGGLNRNWLKNVKYFLKKGKK